MCNDMVKKAQQRNVDMMIPSGWNVYDWAEEHPGTTIAAALKRIEKIMDFTSRNSLFLGFSSGKDSTVTANLAAMELNLRRIRVEMGIDRYGEKKVDPLDLKWGERKDGVWCARLHGMQTDAEVCWSSSNDYSKRFYKRMGPSTVVTLIDSDGEQSEWKPDDRIRIQGEGTFSALEVYNYLQQHDSFGKFVSKGCKVEKGLDLLQFNHMCLPLSWQSGVSFNSGVLISWSEEWGKDSPNHWVQPMPTKDELYGFEPIKRQNRAIANPVPLSILSDEVQKWHIDHGMFFMCEEQDLWGPYRGERYGHTVKAVANWGRGPILPDFKPGCHEKEEQDDYSWEFSHTSWLVDEGPELRDLCRKRLEKEYDLKHDVWFLKPGEHGATSTSLISLRAEESLDRRVILRQGEYSTGQYSRSGGTNVCSPVFDWSTRDVWRFLSATNHDVNDIYEKMFEAGIAPADQRVGSLLNYAAVRQISTVKSLEPKLFGRLVQRFNNVEFMAEFSRRGYFNVQKPKNSSWDGRNHLKAGYSDEGQTELSDRYEHYLQLLGIPYRREGNEFWSTDPAYEGKPWFPFTNWIKENDIA